MSEQIPATFYRSIMSYPLPKKQPRVPAQLAPAPPLHVPKEFEIRDLLKVFLDTEVGDSQRQKQEFFQKHLKELDRKQLSRMMKKIDRIGKELIETEVEDQFKGLQQFVFETVDSALQISSEKTDALQLKIEKRLKEFSRLSLQKDAKKRKKIRVNKKKMPLNAFVRTFFFDIILEYKGLVAKGLIVPFHSEMRGLQFVAHKIESVLQG